MKEAERNEVYQYLRNKFDTASYGQSPTLLALSRDTLLIYEKETGIDGLSSTFPPRVNSYEEIIDYLKADKVMGSPYTLRMVEGALDMIEAARARKKAKSSPQNPQLQLNLF